MRDLWKLVQSPRHLLVFEAAARLMSFTQAAQELNVSQPAVSYSVRQLEAALGVRLFIRKHRSIALTRAGEQLFEDVTRCFSQILATAQQLARQGQRTHVTILVSTAFATYWVVPRLAQFHLDNPGIELRLHTSNKDLDLNQEGLDLGVRRGDGVWSGYESALIAKELLIPVASPGFVERSPQIRDLSDLAALPLIHLEEPFRVTPTWSDWFAAMGWRYDDAGSGLRLNDYALVIQAAMAGEGIALGWRHTIAKLLDQQLLVKIGAWQWETGAGFYLLQDGRERPSRQVEVVWDWMVSNAWSAV